MPVLAIDIGGTKVRFGAVSRKGKILHSGQFALKRGVRPESVISQIALKSRAAKIRGFFAVGIACAGLVDSSSRKLLFSPNLNWQNVPLPEIAERVLGRPAYIENDVNTAALGEYIFGAGKGTKNLVALFVGTGIGGGIVSEGRLIRGAHGISAEIGHMIFEVDGNLCSCGRKGCFESYAGGRYIVSNFYRLGGDRSLTVPSEIYSAAKKGDRFAKKVWLNALDALSVLCVNLTTALDTEVIVLGGGVVEHCPGIEREISRRVKSYYRGGWRYCPEVVKSALGADAALLGAAFCAFACGEQSPKKS
jgi:glucokinase